MPKNLPSVEELARLFAYDPLLGTIKWRVWQGGTAHAGSEAGTFSAGYRRVNVNGSLHQAHRIAWKMMTGADPSGEIDHKNGDRADNRWENLRQASRAENAHNTRRPNTNTSGFKGVHWHSGARKWRASIKNGSVKPIHLGYFDRPEDAHTAYCAAAEKLHGQFARPL